jgi:vesicle transport through interaction with t-SNAREs protein 1
VPLPRSRGLGPPRLRARPQANLTKLKGDVKKASAALMDVEAARDELLSRAELGDTQGGAATSGAQRDRLLTATDKLKQTGDRIKEGKKTLLETEELGVSILQDLHKQREQIQHTRETLHGADDNIGRSRRILASMGKRAMANKVMLGGIIGILVMLIILVVYVKTHK